MLNNDPNFHDTGRQAVTGLAEHAFKFRSLSLRQLKDARTFFRNGSFTQVRNPGRVAGLSPENLTARRRNG